MGTLTSIIDLLIALTSASATLAPIIKAAQAQGRTTLTPEEWAIITGNDDSAEAQLTAAIAAAKASGK